MEKTIETTPYYTMQEQSRTTDRGAGGKLKRQPPRRPPSTPYARPQQNQSLRRRLLSTLIDPACRLITGGATRIFPSFFTNNDPLSPPEPQSHVQLDEEDREDHANDQDQNCSTFAVSETPGTSGTIDEPKADSDFAEKIKRDQCDGNGDELLEIEKLVKGKTFSRDEINRLLGIINSKAVDIPKVNRESKDLILSTGDVNGSIVAKNTSRPTEAKQDDLNNTARDLTTPLPKRTLLNETGPSPVEIARAFMANRTPDVSLGSTSIISKDERQTMMADGFASEPSFLFASPKPSTRWPGSTVQDQRDYLTPQSQRGRFGLHNIPKTPYSRSIYSKSKSKLAHVRDEGDGFPNGSFSPLLQSQTPAYKQLRSNVVDNGHGSVGPIRRIRHKGTTETPSRGSVYSHSSLNSHFPVENSNVSKGLSPFIKRTMEQGGTSRRSSVFQSVDGDRSSEVSMQPVHPHSSQMARTILEHLDRTQVTPKEKSEELKIATSWKKSQSLDANVAVLMGQNNVPKLGLDFSKGMDKTNTKSPAPWNEKSISVASPESTIEANNVKKTTSASDLEVDRTVTMFGNNARSSLDRGKTHDSQMKTARKDHPKFTGVVVSEATSEGLQKRSPNSSGNKPVLSSISVTKPEQKWTFSSDNNIGFTFPVSASSGMSSEPPTPTIVPLLSGNSQHQPKEDLTGPSYSFGLKRSSPALVFSFPSTSSAPKNVDGSDITFDFGSDRSSRISFGSVGKNTICH